MVEQDSNLNEPRQQDVYRTKDDRISLQEEQQTPGPYRKRASRPSGPPSMTGKHFQICVQERFVPT